MASGDLEQGILTGILATGNIWRGAPWLSLAGSDEGVVSAPTPAPPLLGSSATRAAQRPPLQVPEGGREQDACSDAPDAAAARSPPPHPASRRGLWGGTWGGAGSASGVSKAPMRRQSARQAGARIWADPNQPGRPRVCQSQCFGSGHRTTQPRGPPQPTLRLHSGPPQRLCF